MGADKNAVMKRIMKIERFLQCYNNKDVVTTLGAMQKTVKI